jgi:hypothetical protein
LQRRSWGKGFLLCNRIKRLEEGIERYAEILNSCQIRDPCFWCCNDTEIAKLQNYKILKVIMIKALSLEQLPRRLHPPSAPKTHPAQPSTPTITTTTSLLNLARTPQMAAKPPVGFSLYHGIT